MRSASKAAVVFAVAVSALGAAASASADADARAAHNTSSKPALHLQQNHQVQTPGSLRGHGDLGGAGRSGCHVYYHVQNHPALTEVRNVNKPLRTDGEKFALKVMHLDSSKTYYFKLRCGSPLRTVASDSDHPDPPLRRPRIVTQGAPEYTGHLHRGTIRLYGYTGHDGHLGCSVWEHAGGHPKLTLLRHKDAYKADNEQFALYVRDLNLTKRYYFKLRCGKPLHTVASDSGIPTQPA